MTMLSEQCKHCPARGLHTAPSMAIVERYPLPAVLEHAVVVQSERGQTQQEISNTLAMIGDRSDHMARSSAATKAREELRLQVVVSQEEHHLHIRRGVCCLLHRDEKAAMTPYNEVA